MEQLVKEETVYRCTADDSVHETIGEATAHARHLVAVQRVDRWLESTDWAQRERTRARRAVLAYLDWSAAQPQADDGDR